LNAVIRAVVKHAVLHHGIEVLGIRDGLTGLTPTPPQAVPLTPADVHGLIDRGGTMLGTTNKGSPFRDVKQGESAKARITAGWRALGLDGMIVVGGDGTQFMARQLLASGLKIVGVPKTIDNDLLGTELTVGFSTAVEIATEAAQRLKTSAEAHNRVMILEVMGRDAGHIALQAGLAGGAHVVLLPEIPFDYKSVVAKLQERHAAGRHDSLIVVAEGAHARGGQPSYKPTPSGNKILGGIAHTAAQVLHEHTGYETRVTVLGHIQRGGPPNAADRILATQFGVHAVDLVARKKFGRVVAIKNGRLTDVSYDVVKEERRVLALDDELIATAEAVGICLGRALGSKRGKGKQAASW
jgi:6-phosphofructokinase 1